MPSRPPIDLEPDRRVDQMYWQSDLDDGISTWSFIAPSPPKDIYRLALKRGMDVVLSTVGLLVLLPFFALLAILVRISSPGPVLLKQTRVGARNKVFSMVKFRTMVEGAELPGVAVWAGSNDERVTRIGRVLRLTHLDELPQLWNVLAGSMSLVGPRPERPEFDALLEREIPYWSWRYAIRPGLTGWAQVCQGYTNSVESSREKLAYDLYYLRHCSMLLDLSILARTAWAVLWAARSS